MGAAGDFLGLWLAAQAEDAVTPDPVHIRMTGWAHDRYYCQQACAARAPEGSISLRHYREQPWHAASLRLCKACVERADQIREGESR